MRFFPLFDGVEIVVLKNTMCLLSLFALFPFRVQA